MVEFIFSRPDISPQSFSCRSDKLPPQARADPSQQNAVVSVQQSLRPLHFSWQAPPNHRLHLSFDLGRDALFGSLGRLFDRGGRDRRQSIRPCH